MLLCHMELWHLLVVGAALAVGYIIGSWISWHKAEESVFGYFTGK